MTREGLSEYLTKEVSWPTTVDMLCYSGGKEIHSLFAGMLMP